MESGKESPSFQNPLWLRTIGILIGFLCFIWLPIEDTNIVILVGLAVAICAWLATRILLQCEVLLVLHILIGAVAGAAVIPTALLLMAIKGGLHDHGFADFLPLQVRQVLAGFPFWILSGLLFGLIIGVLRRNRKRTT